MTKTDLNRLAKDVTDLEDEEKKLIALIRRIGHGYLKIFVRGGVPYRVEEGIESIMLAEE